MGRIDYSLNGKKFRDYGIFISGGFRSLFSGLKLRDNTSYVWKNYHGIQSDPYEKPMFAPREITLTGWVEGESWIQMKDRFDTIISEFHKTGTQRLICEAYGEKTIVCDVKLKDGVPDLEGKTKDGKNIGVFTLKMVEENPIKKILRIESSELHLSFKSGKWIDINTGYSTLFKKGDVSINKTLPFETSDEGNLILGSSEAKKYYQTSAVVNSNVKEYTYGADSTGTGSYTLYAIARNKATNTFEVLEKQSYTLAGPQRIGVRFSANLNLYGKLVFTLQNSSNQTLPMSKAVLKTGYESFDYEQNVNTHFISLAGDVDEITDLNTNAEVLWNKL